MAVEPSFGIVTNASSPTEIQALEAMPFDSFWVGGHVTARNPSQEVMMRLAHLAALTKRVRIGSAALVLPLYPPALIAKQVADLDQLSKGRVSIAVGVGGEYPKEFEACGIPMSERGARMDEAIPMLRGFWTGEELTSENRFYPMRGVRILPVPVQDGGPPIVIAGRRTAAMHRAARMGDGWMPYLYSADRYQRSVFEIVAEAERTGTKLEGFRWMLFAFVNAQESAATARIDAAEYMSRNFGQKVDDSLLDSIASVGTADEVAVGLKAYMDAGVEEFVIAPATAGDQIAMSQRIAEQVIPLLRG